MARVKLVDCLSAIRSRMLPTLPFARYWISNFLSLFRKWRREKYNEIEDFHVVLRAMTCACTRHCSPYRNVRIYPALFLFKQRVWYEVVRSAHCHCRRHLSPVYFVWRTGVSLSPGQATNSRWNSTVRGCGPIAREHAKPSSRTRD